MKSVTIILPDQTHGSLTDRARSHGIPIDQYCSILLTEIAARETNNDNGQQRARSDASEAVPPSPSSLLSQNELLADIIAFLTQNGGGAQKAAVEEALFQKHKALFEQAYYSELVGGGVPRWKKNVQFARHTGKSFGLIKVPGQAGRGFWELTEKGRHWRPE